MPIYYQAPQRATRGYATFRDAADDVKRRQMERLAQQQEYAPMEGGISDDYYDEFGDPGFYDDDVNAPEWLARHAMPPVREPEEPPMPFEQPPQMSAEEAAQIMREHDPNYGSPLPTPGISNEYFQPTFLDRAGKYIGESIDAFGRAAANSSIPYPFEAGDKFAAGMNTLTGLGDARGDYATNLRRENARTELGALNSPTAALWGHGFGSFLGGAMGRKKWLSRLPRKGG